MSRWGYIVFALLAGMVGQGCSSRAIHEAEAVVAQADSLWQAGLMYGIDAGDSLTLAQAYKTLGDIPLPFGEGLGLGPPYAHSCYHYAARQGASRRSDAGLHQRHPFPHARLPYFRSRV